MPLKGFCLYYALLGLMQTTTSVVVLIWTRWFSVIASRRERSPDRSAVQSLRRHVGMPPYGAAIRIPRLRRGDSRIARRPAPISDNGTSRAPSPTQQTKFPLSLRGQCTLPPLKGVLGVPSAHTGRRGLTWQSVSPSPAPRRTDRHTGVRTGSR